jgi:glutamate/aspartate transport system permease protein
MPVGFRTILPPLTNDFLGTFKNSSLLLTIGVLELTAQTRRVDEYTFQSFEAFICATVLYCSITLLVITAMRLLERRSSGIGMITANGEARAKRI